MQIDMAEFERMFACVAFGLLSKLKAEDSEHYPCFDSSDYAYENRYYCNFIFSRDKDELVKKLKELKAMRQLSSNYNKFTQIFHPMAYWEGDTHHDVYVTEDE